MADDTRAKAHYARMCIVGMTCNQAFVYAAFYLGFYREANMTAQPFARLDLLMALTFVVVALVLVRLTLKRGSTVLLSAAFLAASSLAPVFGAAASLMLEASPVASVLEGALVGFPAGVMLCAWGHAMGRAPIEQSVPIVFIGSAFAAGVCLVLSTLPAEGTSLVSSFLLVGSAVALRAALGTQGAADRTHRTQCREEGVSGIGSFAGVEEAGMSREASSLSWRILAGTVVYGLAAGLMETFGANASDVPASFVPFMLLVFVLYCLAALQLFGGKAIWAMRAVLPASGDDAATKEAGPLDGSYRLAVLLMMAGFLLVPVLQALSIPEESVVLAGYLSIWTVLLSLFLVMARIGASDAATSFAHGFSSLFLGEAAGVLLGNWIADIPFAAASTITGSLAGVLVLYGYLYLFTEHDLRALSLVIEEKNRFEEACAALARQFGLSKREAEILPLALRGRTSERMASEFSISKNTVDTHMRRIYTKCGVHSRQELIDLGERMECDIGQGGAS